MLIEVFKSGSHTDSNGITTTYSLEQINQIVTNYNQFVAEHPNDLAPLVKGHPKNNAPAFGWVRGLIKKNNTIFADIEDIAAEFIVDIKNKKFKNFSIALYPNLLLRHIGILGAVPPAVKGLNKYGILNFHNDAVYNEYDYNAKNNLIENNLIENNSKKENISEINKTYSESSKEIAKTIPTTDTDIIIQKLKETNALLINKLHSLEKQSFLASIQTFTESICNSPNSPITPTQKDVLIDILEHTYNIDKNNSFDKNYSDSKDFDIDNIKNYLVSYSENQNGLTAKIKRFLSSLTNEKQELCKHLDFKEYSNNNVFDDIENPNVRIDLEKNELHKKALQYMSLHSEASYMDALNNVI